jgi:nicotinate phosphoribosyltransferase
LVAVHQEGEWLPAIKISESPQKTPNPGYKRVWRLYDRRHNASADLLSLEDEDPRTMELLMLRHPSNHSKHRRLNKQDITEIEPLLVDIMVQGKLVYNFPSIEEIRAVRQQDLAHLDAGVKRIMNPHIYHVSLTPRLWDMKQDLIESIKYGD